MHYDVFISYKRGARDALCDLVRGRIMDWGLQPFVDRWDLKPGESWIGQMLKVADQRPKVVVLVNRAAAVEGCYVFEEVRAALDRNLDVIPILLDDTPYTVFGIRKDTQYIDAKDCTDDAVVLKKIDRDLWVSLHDDTKVLEGLRDETRSAVNGILVAAHRGEFWRRTKAGYLPVSSDHHDTQWALVAPGGSGKSVLIALHLQELRLHRDRYPVILDRAVLRGGKNAVSRLLGARQAEELPVYLGKLRALHGARVTLAIDSLDGLGAADELDQIADLLVFLSGHASIIVGCRPEVWKSKFASRLSFEVRTISELSDDVVDSFLSNVPVQLRQLRILRIPFFLSYVLEHTAVLNNEVASESKFLTRIWDQAARTEKGGQTRSSNKPELLRKLARLQLLQNRFDVPIHEFLQALGSSADNDLDREELRRVGLLQETEAHAEGGRVRLRHDLLDAFNVAQLLADPNEGPLLRQKLYADVHRGLGRHVLQSLVQGVHDFGIPELLQEIFQRLLDMLDRKGLSTLLGASATTREERPAMANAWEATFVLYGKFEILSDFIVRVLDGEIAASLEDIYTRGEEVPIRSCLGERPMVTQEAASSLASAFLELAQGDPRAPQEAIAVLTRNLDRWKFRGRIVEALAKYRQREAVEAIEEFAIRELARPKRDKGVFEYIARALGTLSPLNRDSAIEILERLRTESDPGSTAQQDAVESLNRYDRFRFKPLPPIELTDEVLIEQLRLRDQEGRYTDWRKILKYVGQVRGRAHLSDELMDAVCRAIEHQQTHAQEKVVECLADIDHPRARAALLAKLGTDVISHSVREACFRAVGSQLASATGPMLATRRCLVHRAANHIAASGDVGTAESLRRLLDRPELTPRVPLLLIGIAAEVLPGLRPPSGRRAQAALNVVAPAESPLEPDALAIVTQQDIIEAGPPIETKYRFVALARPRDDLLSAELVEIGWGRAKGFHTAMLRDGERVPPDVLEAVLAEIFRGAPRVPGVAVVHAVVVTSDDKVIFQRRSESAGYAPGHWSATFEEQITTSDFVRAENAAVVATRRGFEEEFHTNIWNSEHTVDVVGVLMQMDTLNIGLVTVAKLTLPYEVILRNSARTTSDPQERSLDVDQQIRLQDTATAIDAIDVADVRRDPSGYKVARLFPLHPTSAIRLVMLERWRASSA